ncbi:MAG: glycosyltransferase N-terminal domain-containing protein [Winogradskyella sp.]
MRLLYSIGIAFAGIIIKIIALFNSKLKLGVLGRKETFRKLKNSINQEDKTFWFHCASLGEYEQGLPVFEALKSKYPNYKVVISFFSPSGYEIRKNTKIADVVVYLPLDTKNNAKRFLNIVNPDFIVFVKYEIWPNFLFEIKKRNLNAILISAVFREKHSFFKWYGKIMRLALFAFNHIFVQDESSKSLLESIDYNNVTLSGDTRFDRVTNQLSIDNAIPFIESFKNNKTCVVFGSTWPDDDELFLDYINSCKNDDVKYIIAPHNIKPSYAENIKSSLKVNTLRFSEMKDEELSTYKVFILDTIGYLSKVYSYADIVYIGGAAGTTGLHNILEPAVFGVPIIIGKNYSKFPEALKLISLNGVTTVKNKIEFSEKLEDLIKHPEKIQLQGDINKNFVADNKGAVGKVLNYIKL